jgi:hypothetical protein
MSLLLAEEAPSFYHEALLLFVTEWVPGANGIYIYCIWVMRGGSSSLSALSKVTLPLLRLAGLAITRAYIWQYCAYVISVHWMPRTGVP